MDRDALLLLALGSLAVAGLTVGVSGWVLVVRERRLAAAAATTATAGTHHEAPEEE